MKGERRKVIQISALAGSEENFETVYALCDDGTIWWWSFGGDKSWICMNPIPQDDDD